MNERFTYLEMVMAAGMCRMIGSNWKFVSTIGSATRDTVAGLVFPSMTMRDTLITTGLVGEWCGCCFLFVYKKRCKYMLIDFVVYQLYSKIFDYVIVRERTCSET